MKKNSGVVCKRMRLKLTIFLLQCRWTEGIAGAVERVFF
jgi:hypothetical protein